VTDMVAPTKTACSGANSQDIQGQISALPSGLDLVLMTAGGNDLCLVSLPFIYCGGTQGKYTKICTVLTHLELHLVIPHNIFRLPGDY
jgi:hypothetical protein